MLEDGDVFPGYSIKNDGTTFVIASAQSIDSSVYCLVKEEGSPYSSGYSGLNSFQIYGKHQCHLDFIAAALHLHNTGFAKVLITLSYMQTPSLIIYDHSRLKLRRFVFIKHDVCPTLFLLYYTLITGVAGIYFLEEKSGKR